VAVTFPYRFSLAAEKRGAGHTAAIHRSLETIKAYEEANGPRQGDKPLVILDGLSCGTVKYYMRDHAIAKETIGEFASKRIERQCTGRGTRAARRKISRALPRGFWLIVSKTDFVEPLEQYVQKRCSPDVLMLLDGPTLLAHCPPTPR
jgi:hypothetical protein